MDNKRIMTRHDWMDKIKKTGEILLILLALSVPVGATAKAYIERAVDAKLIQLDSKIGSLETRTQTMEIKVDSLSMNIKHNTEVMDGLIKMLIEDRRGRITNGRII